MSKGILNTDGKLAKLTVMAFEDKRRMIPLPGEEFRAMFNPTEFSKRYDLSYGEKNTIGKSKSQLLFKNSKAQTYVFHFLIDGTGATGEKVDVSQKIIEFLSVVHDYSAKENTPKPLKIFWGEEISKCVLISAEVKYTLFKPDGKPLRATIKASFKEEADQEFIKRLSAKTSANKDKIRKIKDGDQLTTIAQSVYGNVDGLMAIAKKNGLDNFRNLPKGLKIILPSLKRKK